MRSEYAIRRLRDAADALASLKDGDIRAALYAAHLQLHTLKAQHLPEGDPQQRLLSIQDRFTRRHPGDFEEHGVVDLIERMDDGRAVALAQDIRALWDEVAAGLGDLPANGAVSGAVQSLHTPYRSGVTVGGRVLIVFGSTDGHTRGLAAFVAAELTARGYEVVVREASHANETRDIDGFAAVLIAASIHWARYQSSVVAFAKDGHEALNPRPSALISVSLSAAGVPQPEPETLDDFVGALREETLWEPSAVHHVGGRIRHSGYDYFKRLAVTLIAGQRGEIPDQTQDYDLADYGALKSFVTAFVAGEATAQRAPAVGSRQQAPRQQISGGR